MTFYLFSEISLEIFYLSALFSRCGDSYLIMVSLPPAMIAIKDSLRSATPLREAEDVYVRLYVHLYCYQNRQVEGRQVADPYGGTA